MGYKHLYEKLLNIAPQLNFYSVKFLRGGVRIESFILTFVNLVLF